MLQARTIFENWLSKQKRRLGSRQLDNGSEPEDILFDFIQTLVDDNFIQEDLFTDYLEGLFSDAELEET